MHAYLIGVYFFFISFYIGALLFGFVICCFQIAYTTVRCAATVAAVAAVVVGVVNKTY